MLFAVTVRPTVFTAVAVTTNRCEVPSVQLLRHTVPSWLNVPEAWVPDVWTVTLVSLPRAAVTVIPAPGLTSLLPLAGVMVTCAAGMTGAALAFCDLAAPEEHAAASASVAAAMSAAADLTAVAVVGACWPRRRSGAPMMLRTLTSRRRPLRLARRQSRDPRLIADPEARAISCQRPYKRRIHVLGYVATQTIDAPVTGGAAAWRSH